MIQVSFETLDPEQMNNTTMKYAKSVMQLEKGLPPNGVVPMLKERVETMRDRVSDHPPNPHPESNIIFKEVDSNKEQREKAGCPFC